jgi:hypothetical protein
MEHIFVNSGHISLIVSDLERYDVGLPEYEINLRNFNSRSDDPNYPVSLNFHHLAFQGG